MNRLGFAEWNGLRKAQTARKRDRMAVVGSTPFVWPGFRPAVKSASVQVDWRDCACGLSWSMSLPKTESALNVDGKALPPEVETFRGFLRIPTVSFEGTGGSYRKAVDYLRKLLDSKCKLSEFEIVKGKPVLVATLEGTDPSLKSLVLNSHYDVVPCVREKWTVDPFEACVTPEGLIVARGTQDMKSVCIQYVLALLRLIARGVRMRRTVHLLFVPDEEIGGFDGMDKFIKSGEFAKLNCGVALDEGLANAGPNYTVFYGERAVWWVKIRATGPTGHGSRFIQNTAMEKLVKVINSLLEFRKGQHELHQGCRHAQALKLGDVATVNLTALEGGVKSADGKNYALNVIPTEAMAGFDIRLPPRLPIEKFSKMMDSWTAEQGVTCEFVQRVNEHSVSSIDRKESPFWGALEDVCQNVLKVKLETEIFPAGTDGRYIRSQKIPVYGFSPMNNTKVLLHDHDEHISVETFMKGIEAYEKIIPALANVISSP